jgi:hypothetical protein
MYCQEARAVSQPKKIFEKFSKNLLTNTYLCGIMITTSNERGK